MPRARLAAISWFAACTAAAQDSPAVEEEWIALFNGRDLDGWTVKIRGHAVGENYANTFRVVDGLLTVAYDDYTDFAEQFGHIFYAEPFSHYRLRVEYRFVGEQAPSAPESGRTQQRRDAALASATDHGLESGLSDIARVSVPRRRK